MGLLRALLISGVVVALWQIIQHQLMHNLPLSTRAKWGPWVPVLLVFLIEVLL